MTGDDVDTLARALHRAHLEALDTLHGRETYTTEYDLEPPERRAYLREQARALIAAGWGDQ